MLVLAGAGSGKTRVLTVRIAHLIYQGKIDPAQVFAVTFTNKAASEMRERIYNLLPHSPLLMEEDGMWMSTFHSACMRILRSNIHQLGYSPRFTIYDDTDQLSLIKAIMKELNVSDSAYSPKAMQSRINRLKNDGINAEQYQPSFGGPYEDAFMRIFDRYAEVLKLSSAVDFADLILLTVQLFEDKPKTCQVYQDRFRYLLVDEYQDTNRCQYKLIRLLAGENLNVCAVGDEDQSIYKWRGADISNIMNFEKDFPNTKIFKLEENYRSTKNIIEAASHVISFNTERREKTLWTQNPEGERLHVIECHDEHDESVKAVNEIRHCLADGFSLNQIALFYRTNAQSRLLEDLLRAHGINYMIYGGTKFYDRLEIKDALAYLKLIANERDDVSFRRIVNVPARGIGEVSLKRLEVAAKKNESSLFQLLSDIFGVSPKLHIDLGRSQKKFQEFYQLIDRLKKQKQSLLPSDLLNGVLEETGYRQSLVNEQSIEAQGRLENLAELRQSIVEYELRRGATYPDELLTLEGFLEQVALVSDIDRFDPSAPSLKMMTIHMAKGLEFDIVFIVGLEEELFPNIRAWDGEDISDIEEERRLMYVGMTRAKQKLYLLFAKNRTVFGMGQFRVVSRFVDEIPKNYIEFTKSDFFSRRRTYLDRPGLPNAPPRTSYTNNDFSQVYDEDNCADDFQHDLQELKKGSRVMHPTFGEGIIREKAGADKLLVEFTGRGIKKISLKFTQLKAL